MSDKSKKKLLSTKDTNALRTISTLENSLLSLIEPVIHKLDQHANIEHGSELPSRQDKGLKAFLGNLCRDVYQQIHGVKTDTYTFYGVKEMWDRVEATLANHYDKHAGNPEDLDSDPNTARYLQWYEVTDARMQMLNEILAEFKSVYRTVTGVDWVYQPPGTTNTQSKTNPTEAAARIRTLITQRQKNSTTTTN